MLITNMEHVVFQYNCIPAPRAESGHTKIVLHVGPAKGAKDDSMAFQPHEQLAGSNPMVTGCGLEGTHEMYHPGLLMIVVNPRVNPMCKPMKERPALNDLEWKNSCTCW